MIKKIITVFLVFLNYLAIAQGERTIVLNDNTRKIEVSGSAEMKIVPDEIYYTISLQEYKNDNKKVEIETLEKQLIKAVADASIPKENLQIENLQGYKPYWDKKKKNDEFMASKQYVLKLNNLYKINDIISAIDSKGIAYTNISKYSHTKIEEFRKEIKVKALQAAKAKASYLLAAINEQLGEVLLIQETGDYYPQPYDGRMANMVMEKSQDMQSPQIDFKEIELRFEVRAVFKIK